MNRVQKNELVRLINAHTKAQIDLSWRGVQDPWTQKSLRSLAEKHETALNLFIEKLFSKEPKS
jgi:hypothetical protein